MNKREQRKTVRENRQRLFLDAWKKEKACGNSLSAFCRSYGLSRKNLYLWLKRAGQNRQSIVGSVDWTEYKLRSGKIFILLFLDEASRFWLGSEIFEARPRTEDLTGCLEHILDRYQARPLFLKSDRAKVFMAPAWEILLARHGILPYRVRTPLSAGSRSH